MKDMSVGALAYDTVPLSSVGKLDIFSPEFQSLVTDKGAMILHMLRWVIGDQKYRSDHARRSPPICREIGHRIDDFRSLAEQNYGQQAHVVLLAVAGLNWRSRVQDQVHRLPAGQQQRLSRRRRRSRRISTCSACRSICKIDTDGKTENKRIEVVGTNSAFTVETFGKPRRIAVDPDDRVLKNSSESDCRCASILRGQGLIQQGDLAGALLEFNKALDVNKNSSLAHYRIAEVFFLQSNFQAAANAYRDCLNGDGEPRWTEVWSHIQLGKIFDVTGQRERATNEYRQALQTNDNTQGALDEARKYLQKAFEQQKNG